LKISYNWIREYVEFDWSPEELAGKLIMAGLEVEEITEVVPKFEKIIVGKIINVKQHPNASKLSLCSVDIGDKIISVICGAPNVKENHFVVVALPEAVLPTDIQVSEEKIRGVVSEGMLCSEKELGISDDHSGIMLLNGNYQCGELFKFDSENRDIVLDIFLTPNRGDCMSMVGVAREIATLSNSKLKLPQFHLEEDEETTDDLVKIEIQDKVNCPRYTARIIKNVKISSSPFWLIKRLKTIGLRAINNIVDITNYVLVELGQPLHAFDFNLIYDQKIIVRLASDGEKFTTLDGVERSLDKNSLLICDGKRPVALAGIMGGINTEVTDKSEDVLLESAYFNPINIRKTSSKLNLSTEASIRFERRVNPEKVDFASHRAIALMKEIAGGKIVRGCLDVNYLEKEKKVIILRPERVSKILGKKIPDESIVSILKGLEFEVKNDKNLLVNVPSFRSDITREIDLIEEIARIYGYDNIEESQFSTISIQINKEDNVRKYINEFRDIFIGLGFYEVITTSITGESQNNWIESEYGLIKIKNPLSEEMSWLRKTLVENILWVMKYNKNRGLKNVRIFEIGKVYSMDKEKKPTDFESLYLTGALEGMTEFPNWESGKNIIDFYYVKGILETFFDKIMLDNYEFFYYDKKQLSECCGIKIDNVYSGFFGKVNDDYLDIPGKCKIYVFELFLNNVINKISQKILEYKPIPQYPSIDRDLAFVVSEEIKAEELINNIKIFGGEYLKKVDVFDLYEGSQISKDKKSIGLSLQFYSMERTLKESEVDEIINKIIKKLNKSCGAKLREK
jgi:phenylalanyl-tRNA synthetase beta chain